MKLFDDAIKSDRVYLRQLMPDDVNCVYLKWMKDPEVTQYLESRFYDHTEESLREYVKAKYESNEDIMFSINLRHNHSHIGNIKLGPINFQHMHAEVGILIGEKAYWGMGYATESIRCLVDYAFENLNLNKLTAGCYSVNIGSKKAFERAGFIVEGVRRKYYVCDGQYTDAILMGCLKEN